MTIEDEKAARRRAEEAFYVKLGPNPAFPSATSSGTREPPPCPAP